MQTKTKEKKQHKSLLKICSCFLGVAILSAAIATPIECCKTQTQIVQSNANLTTNSLQSNTTSFNLNDAVKHTSEKAVLEKLERGFNQQDSAVLIASSKENNLEIKEEKILHTEAVQNVKQIYDGKINPQLQMNQIKKEFDVKHSQKQLDQIQTLINNEKYQVELQRNLQYKEIELRHLQDDPSNCFYYFYHNINNTVQNTNQKLHSLENELKEGTSAMLAFATVSTAASIASAAIAIAIWAIPFFGWIEEGFAIADTAVDCSAAGVAWGAYYSLSNSSQQVQKDYYLGATTVNTLSAETIYGDWKFATNNISKIPDTLDAVDAISAVDEATNAAGSTAEPEVASWYDVAIDIAASAIDALSISVGIASQYMPLAINQIQQEIEQLKNKK